MSRSAAALAAAVSALGGAGNAFGQSVVAQGVEAGATNAAAATGVQQGAQQQAAQQLSNAAQDAAAQATAVQANPVNVAAPKVIASPGAGTSVKQTNDATGAAGAANQAATTQDSGQVQAGGVAATGASAGSGDAQPAPSDPPSSGPAASTPRPSERPPSQNQSGTQSAGTTQAAGAQATTLQTQPINVTIPVIVASPGANIKVIQSNTASSAAAATNSSFTTQLATQAQLGGPGSGKGQVSVPAPSLPPGERSPTGSGDETGPGSGPGGVSLQQFLNTIVQSGGSALVWNWNIEINVSSIPGWKTSDLEAPPVPWTPSEASRQPAEKSVQVADRSRGEAQRKPPSLQSLGAATSDALPPANLNSRKQAKQNVSSNSVQPDHAMPLEPLIFPPLEPQAVPGSAAGSGGVAPLPLVGALLAVAFATAAGLLGRRLALRGAGLRRQTSLSPLERPG